MAPGFVLLESELICSNGNTLALFYQVGVIQRWAGKIQAVRYLLYDHFQANSSEQQRILKVSIAALTTSKTMLFDAHGNNPLSRLNLYIGKEQISNFETQMLYTGTETVLNFQADQFQNAASSRGECAQYILYGFPVRL